MTATHPENGGPRTLTELLLGRKNITDKGIVFIPNGQEEIFVSYASLLERASRVLAFLQEQGLGVGDELVFQEDDNERFLLAFWACILGGIIPVPLAVGGKKEHQQKLIHVWGAMRNPYLLAPRAYFDKLNAAGISLPGPGNSSAAGRFIPSDDMESCRHTPQLASPRPDDLAYLQFSSGSTGEPKGVMLTHENLVYNTLDITEGLKLTPDRTTLSWVPLTHDFGMIGFHLTSVMAGCQQCVIPTALFIRRPLAWMDKTHEHRANVLYSPNFGYEYFLRAFDGRDDLDWDLSCVEAIINGAEPISADLCRQFTRQLSRYRLRPNAIAPAYGLAEASVGVTLNPVGTPIRERFLDRQALKTDTRVPVDAGQPGDDRVSFVHVGLPLRHCRVRVCDEQDQPLPAGVIGQIQVRGRNVTRGYYHNAAATARIFTPDHWLRTGDLGFLTETGELVFTGRRKNMIIIQGQNYYPQDIERLLFDIDGISLGAVVACGLPGAGNEKEKLLIFLLFKKPLSKFPPLMEAVNARLADVLGIVPDFVIPVREILKTTSGKVQHYAFVEQFLAGSYDQVINELRALYATRLTEVWKPLGKIARRLAIEDWLKDLIAGLLATSAGQLESELPLNDQGMQSIHAVQLRNSIQQKLDLHVPVGLMYKYPTIRKLAAFIESALFLDAGGRQHGESAGEAAAPPLLDIVAALSDEEIIRRLEA